MQKELLLVVVILRYAHKFFDISPFKRWFNSSLLECGHSDSLPMSRI